MPINVGAFWLWGFAPPTPVSPIPSPVSRSTLRSAFACALPFKWSNHASSPEQVTSHTSHVRATPGFFFSPEQSVGSRFFCFFFFFGLAAASLSPDAAAAAAAASSAASVSARSSAPLNPPAIAHGFVGSVTGVTAVNGGSGFGGDVSGTEISSFASSVSSWVSSISRASIASAS